MDRELHHELRPRGVDHYRREARALLRAVRAADEAATARALAALGPRARERFVLADALHVVAVEHGHRSWPAFKHDLEATAGDAVRGVGRISADPASSYAAWAGRLLASARAGGADAIARLRANVPRLAELDAAAVAARATDADARVCLAHEYGFRTWTELAEATDRAHETHYSRLPAAAPWKRAEAAIRAGDAATLRTLLDEHPGLEQEDWGMTLLAATTQPEAGAVPREIVDMLVEAGSEIDGPLNLAACFDKADVAGWLLDAGADATGTRIWGVTPMQTAVYHGARHAIDLLAARGALVPEALYVDAAIGDVARVERWFDADGRLRPEAFLERPNLADVGWPPRPPQPDDAADVLAEALSFAALLGRTAACARLIARGADPARAPLYGVTPLAWAQRSPAHRDAELVALLAPAG